jgi:hypothetical protein
MSVLTKAIFTAVTIAFAGQANAGACDYTMSRLAGKSAAAITGGAAVAGAGMQAAGYYTLVHAGSGLTMLGSTAAGVSAAGTVGIIGGTSGVLGTIGAILMAPVTLVIGGIAIVGVGSFEGYCYFQVERITDPYEVRDIIENIELNDDAVRIVTTKEGPAMSLRVPGENKVYLLRDLYIVDGQLKHRDWGPNTTLGPVAYKAKELAEPK